MKSEAQRKFLWANHPEVAARWEKETPNGIKLPKRVKHAFLEGYADAFERFGLKTAGREIRLQIPRRSFHNFDAAFRTEAKRGQKQADDGQAMPLEPQGAPHLPSELLASALQALPPVAPTGVDAAKDPLDRPVLWSNPSDLSVGQPHTNGAVF